MPEGPLIYRLVAGFPLGAGGLPDAAAVVGPIPHVVETVQVDRQSRSLGRMAVLVDVGNHLY
jgi:hypothetical protein